MIEFLDGMSKLWMNLEEDEKEEVSKMIMSLNVKELKSNDIVYITYDTDNMLNLEAIQSVHNMFKRRFKDNDVVTVPDELTVRHEDREQFLKIMNNTIEKVESEITYEKDKR